MKCWRANSFAKAAIFPMAAAVGGVIFPAVLLWRPLEVRQRGLLGLPIATDIAFVLGRWRCWVIVCRWR